MSEITLALEHPSLECGEVIARYDLSEIQEKAYQQGKADAIEEIMGIADCDHTDCWDCAFGDAEGLCKINMLRKEWQKEVNNA